MKLTPLDISKYDFERKFRGYDVDEVQAFLRDMARQWEELQDEKRRLEEKLREKDLKLAHYMKVEEALEEALKTGRESARIALENAEKKAAMVLEEAEHRARSIKSEAEDERHQVKRETTKISGRRSEIVARLRAFLMSEMELLARFEGDDPIGFIKLLPAEEQHLHRALIEQEQGATDEPSEEDTAAPSDFEQAAAEEEQAAAEETNPEAEEEHAVAEETNPEAEVHPVEAEPMAEAAVASVEEAEAVGGEATAEETIAPEPEPLDVEVTPEGGLEHQEDAPLAEADTHEMLTPASLAELIGDTKSDTVTEAPATLSEPYNDMEEPATASEKTASEVEAPARSSWVVRSFVSPHALPESDTPPTAEGEANGNEGALGSDDEIAKIRRILDDLD